MGMAYYKNLGIENDLSLPLRESPTRFAVMRRDGMSSNAWGVYVAEGEIYIACRDHMKDRKISLHRSGKRHVALHSGLETTEGNRFLDEWWDPQCNDSAEMVPTFNLFFPSWALCLTEKIRNANAVWDTNQIYIEAAESPMATIVSFCVTDASLAIRFKSGGDSPSFPLAILPSQPGKKLWVIARHIPERNMRELAESGIMGLNLHLASDANLIEKVKMFPNGHVMGISIGGNTSLGGKYLMHYPVDLCNIGATERQTEWPAQTPHRYGRE